MTIEELQERLAALRPLFIPFTAKVEEAKPPTSVPKRVRKAKPAPAPEKGP